MSPLAKLGAYGAALLVVFAAGLGLGRAAGPIEVGDDDTPTIATVVTEDHGHGS